MITHIIIVLVFGENICERIMYSLPSSNLKRKRDVQTKRDKNCKRSSKRRKEHEQGKNTYAAWAGQGEQGL